MADAEKRKKLEAARRKLKIFQQEKRYGKKENDDDETRSVSSSSENQAPSVTSTNDVLESNGAPQIQEYFARQDHAASNFFDAVPPSEVEPPPESLVESLKQISTKINQIVPSDYESRDDGYSNLERRNLELASLYEAEKLRHEQVVAELSEYKERVVSLEAELRRTGDECEARMRRELGPLQEQLQCHMQTVGILVGEKTELSAALSQCQLLLKQRTGECEDLSARLKTSRSRAADLEREMAQLREEKGAENGEAAKLIEELSLLRERHAEARQDVDELREKLKVVGAENLSSAQAVKELTSQLDLANIKIQQLTMVESNRESSTVDGLVEQKHDLEKQLAELNLNLKNAVNERDQASSQYQQYVQQLNNNLSNLAGKLETTIAENESLKKREEQLVRHVGELEKRLQHGDPVPVKDDVPDEALAEVNAQLGELRAQYELLSEKFEDLIVERDELLREVEARKENVAELEGIVERLEGNQADNSKLLAAIESDKVAASRAVQQNAELKKQLEEMQEAFIKMTNDKADLMNSVTSEQYKYKELEEQMQQSNHMLQTLKDAINIKDHELTEMRKNVENSNKAHECTEDENHHNHHHHEHDEEELQKVIFELREELDKLKGERDDLRRKFANGIPSQDFVNKKDGNVGSDLGGNVGKDLSGNVGNDLSGNIGSDLSGNIGNDLSGNIGSDLSGKIGTDMSANKGSDLSNEHLCELNKELAMRQLEAKFMRTMQDIANLQDEKQMLEHLVLQLQGETETIGEYIALYQHQRGVLKQRTHEKETQLKQLAKDREDMKRQLGQLNALVRQLISENGASDDALRQHEALCHEHGGETAEQIMTLLGEIKTSNLVEPPDVPESFHPCPWCSGQLITV